MPVHEFQDREGMQQVVRGDYVVFIEKAVIGNSKASGDEQIAIEARVLTEKGTGPLVFDYAGFSAKRVWTVDVFLKAIKRAPAKGAKLDISNDWLAANAVGCCAWATIGEEEYEGKKKNILERWITNHKEDPYAKFGLCDPKDENNNPPAETGGSTDF